MTIDPADLVPDPFNPGELVPESMAKVHPGQRFLHSMKQRQEGIDAGKVLANGQTIEDAATEKATLLADVAASLGTPAGAE